MLQTWSGAEGTGWVSSLNLSMEARGGAAIIIFNRLLAQQRSFPLVLANEKLSAGFQREACTRDTSASVVLSASQGCIYLESRNQHRK